MSFSRYRVELRARVKLMCATDGVPLSTQWSRHEYAYPTQIAQYGLSHYSRYVEAVDEIVRVRVVVVSRVTLEVSVYLEQCVCDLVGYVCNLVRCVCDLVWLYDLVWYIYDLVWYIYDLVRCVCQCVSIVLVSPATSYAAIAPIVYYSNYSIVLG